MRPAQGSSSRRRAPLRTTRRGSAPASPRASKPATARDRFPEHQHADVVELDAGHGRDGPRPRAPDRRRPQPGRAAGREGRGAWTAGRDRRRAPRACPELALAELDRPVHRPSNPSRAMPSMRSSLRAQASLSTRPPRRVEVAPQLQGHARELGPGRIEHRSCLELAPSSSKTSAWREGLSSGPSTLTSRESNSSSSRARASARPRASISSASSGPRSRARTRPVPGAEPGAGQRQPGGLDGGAENPARRPGSAPRRRGAACRREGGRSAEQRLQSGQAVRSGTSPRRDIPTAPPASSRRSRSLVMPGSCSTKLARRLLRSTEASPQSGQELTGHLA